MDSRRLKGLSNTVLKFKSALNETLNRESSEFHAAINGDNLLIF